MGRDLDGGTIFRDQEWEPTTLRLLYSRVSVFCEFRLESTEERRKSPMGENQLERNSELLEFQVKLQLFL